MPTVTDRNARSIQAVRESDQNRTSREKIAILEGTTSLDSQISFAFSGREKRGLAIFTIRKHKAAVSKNAAANRVNAFGLKTGPLLCHMSMFLKVGRECSYSLRSENNRRAQPPLPVGPLR